MTNVMFSITKQQQTTNKFPNYKFQKPTTKIENRITKIELPVAEAKLKMKKNSKNKNLARFYLYFLK
jgi:hypothetical protein